MFTGIVTAIGTIAAAEVIAQQGMAGEAVSQQHMRVAEETFTRLEGSLSNVSDEIEAYSQVISARAAEAMNSSRAGKRRMGSAFWQRRACRSAAGYQGAWGQTGLPRQASVSACLRGRL